MTKLLVSVRNVEEAEAALSGGADLIDVKEPLHGSLGAADANTIAAIHAYVGGRVPTSAALGELRDVESTARGGHGVDPAKLPHDLGYAKLGLAGCRLTANWPDAWQAVLGQLPRGVVPVAVCYADWNTNDSPPPDEVLRHACNLGCGAMLVDTYEKRGLGLLDLWPLEQLAIFSAQVRAAGLRFVLAGSLSMQSIPRLLLLAPDYIAVRGAVCIGDRSGVIDAERVREVSAIINNYRRAD